jgi:Glu-tRNA(Gln) amidotransferase subunit E-like FAD-binding protein
MEKIELLARIQKLSSLIHSNDLAQYNLSDTAIEEMKQTLDALTEKYIAAYC